MIRDADSSSSSAREHVAEPGIALRGADDERGVAHAQPRMPALLAVGARTPPVLHQEERKMARRLAQVVGVERAQERITRHAQIEAVHQVDEERLPADPLVQCVHGVDSRGFRLLPDSRP